MQLEKPAGVSEAIKFLTQSPDKYTIAIVTGIVSIFIVSTLIISAIINTKLILYILDCESNFYFYDEISGKRKILNIAIVVTLFILNVLILKYIVPLLLAMLLVYACIVALCRD